MAAYEDASKWNCKNCVRGTEGTQFIREFSRALSSVRWFVALNIRDKSIILSFRGSTQNDIGTFITDLNFEFKQWPPNVPASKVHEGFIESMLKGILPAMTTVKEQLAAHPDFKITIVGHSLGGAQSVLAATYICVYSPHWKSRLRVFTYGEPRVGNLVFAQYYDSLGIPTQRVVNRNDIVARAPPKALGYRHHGSEVWLRASDGLAIYCPGQLPLESKECSDGVETLKYSMTDHFNYLGATSR
ncbi:hypothetical protein H4R33_001293 [Dimargaris cristalligena]|uniref:Alpha/Beta hydrolase protein n=1 Tax=Dimargaris cristalligena TaxID=215637 RepID=A0A4P9ZN38_9FUNG|nr:hypothetical protein H4R33_001293 [Dimargaris cristalligena]RKP34528.1 Alpha/Beta hydrolase protein [Dimargaris cristalligena]|eukprot:RKP34528.1 Alpha/Beta hydrolase protein [Dimargaris cristalligena]